MYNTELIYKSFKNKIIISDKGKELDYSFEDGEIEGECYLCGRYTTKGFEKKKVIKPTFADQELAVNKLSKVVCECCAFSLNFSSLRNYGIFATEETAEHPNLKRFKELILRNDTTPFILCIPTSGQKWISLRTNINYGSENMIVTLENEKIKINRKAFKELIEDVEKLYNLGFTKKEIGSLELNSSKVLKIGINTAIETIKKIEKHKGKGVLKLAVHLAQKEEENDL